MKKNKSIIKKDVVTDVRRLLFVAILRATKQFRIKEADKKKIYMRLWHLSKFEQEEQSDEIN